MRSLISCDRLNFSRIVPIFMQAKTIMATPSKSLEEKALKDLEKNKFMSKYASKIKSLQRDDPELFHARIAAKENTTKKPAPKETRTDRKDGLSLSNQPRPSLLKDHTQLKKKPSLDSIMKQDLIKGLPPSEIEKIWKEYHKDKDRICAVIPQQIYKRINNTAKIYPVFLYAVPKTEGYEFFIGQFDGDSCYFTSIINYQAYQENAPIILTLIHYTDIAEEKGIVLLTGEISTDLMTVQDAQFLANQLQLYYATEDDERRKVLDTFNCKPDEFKHMDVINLLQSSKVNSSDANQGTRIE